MKFSRRPIIIEAFRAGIDDIPDWFMDRVSSNDIILKNDPNGHWCSIKKWNDQEAKINHGDYIANSIFPFVVIPAKHFEAMYVKGDVTNTQQLVLEVGNALDEAGLQFTTPTETYNSLHEDLRDLRRAISAGDDKEAISELLMQLAVTALQGRKDL
jgi:hypothetical protein